MMLLSPGSVVCLTLRIERERTHRRIFGPPTLSLVLNSTRPLADGEGRGRGRGRGRGGDRGGDRGRGRGRQFDRHSATGKTYVTVVVIVAAYTPTDIFLLVTLTRRSTRAGAEMSRFPNSRPRLVLPLTPPQRTTTGLPLAARLMLGALLQLRVPLRTLLVLLLVLVLARRPENAKVASLASLRRRTTPSLLTSTARRKAALRSCPSSKLARSR